MLARAKSALRRVRERALSTARRMIIGARSTRDGVSPFLVQLYYLMDRRFATEQCATFTAVMTHWDACETSLYSFRRAIHRIEKGLATRPRRETFAVDYIGETVCGLERLLQEYSRGNATYAQDVRWGVRALTEYFAVVSGHDERIDEARRALQRLTIPEALRDAQSSAVNPAEMPRYAFGVDDLLHVARTRHSVRDYLANPVPREAIDAAVAVAIESPSACNRQAFSFRIFDDPVLVQRVVAIPMGLQGSSHQIPFVAVLVGNLGAYPEPRDRHLIYIDAALAAMAFVFALQVQGVASCCVNWPDVRGLEVRMRELLGLSITERPVMLVTGGYPDPEGLVPSSCKRPVDEMRLYNRTAAARGNARPSGRRL